MPRMKWEIKNFTPDLILKDTSRKTLSKRINNLKSTIKDYLENETPENLHQVRIAVRRLRYNMEVFISCFVRKKFLIFYNTIENLQDVTGKIRDADVLISNLNSISHPEGLNSIESVVKRIEIDNTQLREELKLLLNEFLHGKDLKDFVKMLKK